MRSQAKSRHVLHQTSLSYNPSPGLKPTLVNNVYVEHLLETVEDEMVKSEIRLAIMDERMRREECILATSPHKTVANAVRYARAINYTLSSTLEKKLKLLHREFEQEFRRIVEVQREATKEDSRNAPLGYTRRQFSRKLSDALSMKRRDDELRRAKTQLSLPSMKISASLTRKNQELVPRPQREQARSYAKRETGKIVGRSLVMSSWKHDGEIVYLPPI